MVLCFSEKNTCSHPFFQRYWVNSNFQLQPSIRWMALLYYKRVIAVTYSFKFTVFLQNRDFRKKISQIIIMIPPWFQLRMCWTKCYLTTSFPAIYFFYDSAIISWEHLKGFICQGHCVYFTTLVAVIHYDKRPVWFQKIWRVCLFENYGSPAFLKVPIFLTELDSVMFVWKALS